MSITATVDGTAYTGIDTITTGGKTIALTESGGGGGSVGDLTEYNSVTVSGSSADASGDLTVEHGLTKAPVIVICNINKTLTADDKGKCVAFAYSGNTDNDGSYYGIYYQTNSNTGAVVPALGTKVDTISSVANFALDSTQLKIRKPGANYNWYADETYTFKFYA